LPHVLGKARPTSRPLWQAARIAVPPRAVRPRRLRLAGLAACAAWLAACTPAVTLHTIRARDLETAPAAPPPAPQRRIVTDPEALRPLYQPLGERMGLIQVRNRHAWELLARCTDQVGPCPDFHRGIIVGLVSEAGTPLNAPWPFRWDSVRIFDGAGWIDARFNGGTYLPDGVTCLETAYVPGLQAVLVVNLDGSTYYLP
jgi:hypothetical protein